MAEAESILTLDASDFVSGAEEADESMQNLSSESEETQDTLFGFENAGAVAAGAITGVGGAITGTVEGSKDWRESLGRTRIDLGLTQEETEGLAQSISNSTFPMDDAVATMDSLAQQGITTTDSMEEVAGGADNIADATGQTAESVATNLGPAMTALGDDLDELPEKQDSFTKAMRRSMLDAPQLSKALQQSADELNEMGLNSSESADLLGAFAEETGLTGRELRQQFREELQNADGDMQTFQEQTGITDQALTDYKSTITESGNLTSQYADSANESVSAMDEATNFIDEMTLGLGGLLEPIDALGPALMGIGGSLFAASAAGFTASGALTAVGTAAGVLLGPIGLIIGAVALLAAAFATDFMGIRTITEDVIGAIISVIQDLVNFVRPFVEEFLGHLRDEFSQTAQVWQDAIAGFVEWASPYIEAFLAVFSGLWDEHGAAVTETVDTLVGGITQIFGGGFDILKDIYTIFFGALRGDTDAVKEAVLSIFDTLVGGVVDLFTWLYTQIVGGSIIPDLVSDVLGFITDLKDGFISTVTDAKDTVVGIFEDIKSLIIGAGGIIPSLVDGIISALESVGSEAGDIFKSTFNAAIPSSVGIPSVDIPNPVPGEDGWTIGGGSLSLPQLQSGGFIESSGLAMLHSGEEVVRAAEVDRRGGGGGDNIDIQINVNGSGTPDQTARAIERRLGQAGVNAWRS